MTKKRFTISDLKHHVDQTGSFWFTRNNMRHAGDTMKNFGMYRAIVQERDGEKIECWCVHRKKPTNRGMPAGLTAMFCCETYRQVRGKVIDD